MSLNFDRDWQIPELIDGPMLQRCGQALAQMLGGDARLIDAQGRILWPADASSEGGAREALVLELEPIGWLLSSSANAATLQAGARLLQYLLRAQLRYKMAANLHVQAMSEDYESLRLEHAKLLESEARYKALAAELEARVEAQVAQLEERQQRLYEAERLASVGQLAAGVAHEVNNPLGFVRSNLGTFQHYLARFAELRSRLDQGSAAWRALDLDYILEDAQSLLDECIGGLDRIARIVAELKSFSNVDRADEEYRDVNDCLRHAVSVFSGQLPPGVAIELDLQPLPPLMCLPGHLNQLFLNLIRNASQAIADAGHPGTVRIVSRRAQNGILVRISDDGIGMDEAQRARAFEPFYTTRPVGAGAGLGLSSARNIVLAHQGRITLDSEPGRGTTVSMYFPLSA